MGRSGRIPPIRFKQLWENHPTVKEEGKPCNLKKLTDQCAIRLGTALYRTGVKSIPGVPQCWAKDHRGKGHFLRAEDLANGLNKVNMAGIHRVEKIAAEDFHKKINGRTGVIFFKDYWRREHNGKKETFRNRCGDHIDLWNGSRLTDWFSWARIHVRIGDIGIHSVRSDLSNFEDSKAIWFWNIP